MNKIEWDKCFIWMAAMFPQWNASAVTSAAWYGELKDLSPVEFQQGVRAIMAKNPSPFPPGVFEIKGAIVEKTNPAYDAEDAWQLVMKHGSNLPKGLPSAIYKAARTIGNRDLGYVDFDELKWVKKDFCNYFNSIAENNPDLIRLPENTNKQLEGGTDLINGLTNRMTMFENTKEKELVD